MAKKTKRKSVNRPPIGTRWAGGCCAPGDWFEQRPQGLMYHSQSRGWEKSIYSLAKVDAAFGPRFTPPPPAKDSTTMRRKAVAGVLGGWVYGTTKHYGQVCMYGKGALEAVVEVHIPAESYAAFLADPTCGGAAT